MTRKYFGTDGIRGTVGRSPITADFVLRLAHAVGRVLKKTEARPTVLIGKDTRISGYMLESALESGFNSAGVDVVLLGPLPTPGVAYLTRAQRASLGVVISASLGWEIARTLSKDLVNWYAWYNVIGLVGGLVIGLSAVAFEIKSSTLFTGSIFGVVVGLSLGFIGASLFFQGLGLIPHFNLLDKDAKAAFKLATTIVFCYLAIVVVFQSKDHFKLIIPFVEAAGGNLRARVWILDSSVIIDGRIGQFLLGMKVQGLVVVPTFVLNELQTLADSSDKLKRGRGRRGLDLLAELQRHEQLNVEISETEQAERDVDAALLNLARQTNGRLISNDTGLQRVAHLQGVQCINLNELANALRTVVLPGEDLDIELIRVGEQPHQGLGFLEDGTMVVVEHSCKLIGERVTATVTNVLQTQSGRMIFGKLRDHG